MKKGAICLNSFFAALSKLFSTYGEHGKRGSEAGVKKGRR